MSTPLANDRHECFCQEYLVDMIAGRAYERAGFKARGRVADANGARLLANANIQARIAELMKERSKRTQITADRVLEELALIGFSSIGHYTVNDAGFVEVVDDAPDGALRVVSSFKRKRKVYTDKDGGETEEIDTDIKLWNKNTALQDLGKHLGLFGPKGTEDDPQHATVTWRVKHANGGDDGG